ncbi:MAG: hypothetical protein J6R47_02755 [Acholeplasmatales bacterium]|nr:hypothetical protein [Acholeplasmatales bacterium]
MQRNNKICKIIEEFLLYLMDNEYYDVNVDIKQTEEETIITFTTAPIDDKTKIYIIDKVMTTPRQTEIEEYYWMLMGESSAADDLDVIGSLVDKVEIKDYKENSVIRMVRYES